MSVIAILCSDIHFSHTPPVARSVEDDWYAAQERQWMQLWKLFREYKYPPVLIAGDVFDRWNAPVELVNRCIDILANFVEDGIQGIYAIPGQHDLPNHNYDEKHRSAYFTLVQAGVVWDVFQPVRIRTNQGFLTVYPYWWGKEINPLDGSEFPEAQGNVNLALCHSYIWDKGFGYPGADESKLANRYAKRLKGYDVAVFGDNHKGFLKGNILNCGTFYRRRSDERDYEPKVGLLHDDASITLHKLDVSEDKFLDDDNLIDDSRDGGEFSDLLDDLRKIDKDSLDFRAIVKRVLDESGCRDGVRQLVLQAVG